MPRKPKAKKKKPALRKPPERSDAIDEFIGGTHEAPTALALVRASELEDDDDSDENPRVQLSPGVEVEQKVHEDTAVISRVDGRAVRRTTVYFSLGTGHHLAVWCRENGTEKSDVVNALVRQYLEGVKRHAEKRSVKPPKRREISAEEIIQKKAGSMLELGGISVPVKHHDERTLVERADGTKRSRQTIYFEQSVGWELKQFCALHGTDMSDVTDAIVGNWLSIIGL